MSSRVLGNKPAQIGNVNKAALPTFNFSDRAAQHLPVEGAQQATTPKFSRNFADIPVTSAPNERNGGYPLLRPSFGLPWPIQAKLEVGAVNDPLEREADRVAEQVMRMPDTSMSAADSSQVVASAVPGVEALRRKCTAFEDEGKLSRKGSGNATGLDGAPAPPIVHDVLNSPGQPLDRGTRKFFEPRFGADLSSIRVHTDESAGHSAHSVGAIAYTAGAT